MTINLLYAFQLIWSSYYLFVRFLSFLDWVGYVDDNKPRN